MYKKTPTKYHILLIYAALAAANFIAFSRLWHCDFVNYDDNVYVIENDHVKAGLTRQSILWAFSAPRNSFWHPLTMLSHMLDCQLFGLNPHGHHLTSLLLHTANTLLLFGLLMNMTGALWRSAFVAAAFALHPLHVESVAWIAERKDVLSTFFWLLTMAAYVRYTRARGAKWYLVTLLFFALGLMAKPMLITLPFVLLLLDYWPLKRLTYYPLSAIRYPLFEKLPFFALAAAFSIITFFTQQSEGALELKLPLYIRIANAAVSYLTYIEKMFWPARLAAFYPHQTENLPLWYSAVAALLLLAVSIWVLRSASRRKYLVFGWLWYLGTLVPVIGLVQVGSFAMADRYTYVPLTGLFIIIAWGLNDLLISLPHRKIILSTSAFAALSALAICTHLQLRHWQNSVALFEHALNVTTDNDVMHSSLGLEFASQGNFEQALVHYRQALQINPRLAEAHHNMSVTLSSLGRYDEAAAQCRQAILLKPNYFKAYNSLGIVLSYQKKYDQALDCFNRALQIKPDFAEAHNNLGAALGLQGKTEQAVEHFQQALKIKSNYADAYYNLGSVFQSQGKTDQAADCYRKALQSNPRHNNAAEALKILLKSKK